MTSDYRHLGLTFPTNNVVSRTHSTLYVIDLLKLRCSTKVRILWALKLKSEYVERPFYRCQSLYQYDCMNPTFPQAKSMLENFIPKLLWLLTGQWDHQLKTNTKWYRLTLFLICKRRTASIVINNAFDNHWIKPIHSKNLFIKNTIHCCGNWAIKYDHCLVKSYKVPLFCYQTDLMWFS